MRRTRLGCLTGTGLVAALIAAFVVVSHVVANGGQIFSPGELNAVRGETLGGVTSHAEIAGVCSACHVAPWEFQTMDDRCVVCHTDITPQLSDLTTSHGRMYAIDTTANCRACHPEHRGATAILTELDGWKYPHGISGYYLTAHQFKAKNDAFQCADCHQNDVTVFDQKTCVSCHGRIDQGFTVKHILAYGDVCLACHDGRDSITTGFTHADFQFRLVGAHMETACVDCHRGAHSSMDLKSLAQDCASCHGNDDPHFGVLGMDCELCHSPMGWKPSLFDHSHSNFKLTDSHASVACAGCHVDQTFKGAPTDCFSCHMQDDAHGGTLGADCSSCHKPTFWKDITFDHSTTTFGLAGRHVDVTCSSCHKNLVFSSTSRACIACHADVHSGQMGADCASCHNPSGWKDVNFGHEQTGFPLVGSHGRVSCVSCHVNGMYKGISPNCYVCHASKDVHKGQFGTDCGACHTPTIWKDVHFEHGNTGFPLTGSHIGVQCVACHINGIYKGAPRDCVACHASKDAHNGQFGTNCSACHNTSGWKNVSFDHNNTRFPLVASHSNVVCGSCHVNNVYKGLSMSCYACHASRDKHAGQFGTECGACHKPTKWSDVNFNHNSTRFPLSGRHVNVQCGLCHINDVYKGTPSNCYSCHAGRDKHNGQFGTSCGSCHTTNGWGGASFNHSKTIFPLTGKHTSLACTKCHINGVYKGTPSNCYSCHAGKDKHNGQFGTNCGACHTTSSWSGASFNHKNTIFPLVGRHAGLSCTKCHVNGAYKGTPTQCVACHRDEHNGSKGTNCGACHTPVSWEKGDD